MSSVIQRNVYTFKCDAALVQGQPVKLGTDSKHVAACTLNTERAIGFAVAATSAAEDFVEVAMIGGGAKALAGEAITAGKLLVPGAANGVYQTNASGDAVCAVALEGAASGDIFSVAVVAAVATGADA
jgi:hypothetical protein